MSRGSLLPELFSQLSDAVMQVRPLSRHKRKIQPNTFGRQVPPEKKRKYDVKDLKEKVDKCIRETTGSEKKYEFASDFLNAQPHDGIPDSTFYDLLRTTKKKADQSCVIPKLGRPLELPPELESRLDKAVAGTFISERFEK